MAAMPAHVSAAVTYTATTPRPDGRKPARVAGSLVPHRRAPHHRWATVRQQKRGGRLNNNAALAEDAPASDAKHDTGPLRSTETLTLAVFSTSSYMRHTQTNVLNEAFGASNVRSLDVSLSPTTAPLAAGCNAVCLFVNDRADAETIDILADLGVRFIAMRCAGYDRVDLDACRRRGVAVARVPAYSPYAIAEHAIAMMLALNRQLMKGHARVLQGNYSLSGLVGFDMHGKTVGVIGTGKIGR